MKDSNGIPPKEYRKMLKTNYNQSHKEYEQIRHNQNRLTNPIIQKEDRYIPPKTRGNILTEEYVKKMANKPERAHIKRIPIPSNLSSGVTVITEPKKVEGIKLGPIHKNQAHSVERRPVRKKLHKDNFKFFYFDDFNSVKQNQNDLAALRSQVSNKKTYIIIYIFLYLILILQKRYQYRPKEKDNFQFGYSEPQNKTFENIYGYERKYPNTRDRIFNTENPSNKGNKEKVVQKKRNEHSERGFKNTYDDHLNRLIEAQGNKDKVSKWKSKPCNNDYQKVTDEARKNASVRYYYESNYSQW